LFLFRVGAFDELVMIPTTKTQSQDKINELGVRQHENQDQFQPKMQPKCDQTKVTRQG